MSTAVTLGVFFIDTFIEKLFIYNHNKMSLLPAYLRVSPNVPETEGFSHRLRPYKIVGPFFVRWYLRLIVSINQVANRLIRNSNYMIACSADLSHRLLKSYGHFSDLMVEIALNHRHFEKRWFPRVKRMQQSMAHTYTVCARPQLIWGCVVYYTSSRSVTDKMGFR